MPRIRSLKPEAWADKKIGALSIEGRLLFVVLITFADDYGVFSADAGAIWAHGYRHDPEHLASVDRWLQELETAGRIALYVDGDERFGWLPRWADHQRVDHPSRRRQSVPPADIVARFSRQSRESDTRPSGESREDRETRANTGTPEDVANVSRESRNGTTDHGPGTGDLGGGVSREHSQLEHVCTMLRNIGFDALAVEEDRGAIAHTLAERQPPADTDFDVVGQRIRRKLEDGTIERGRPVSALRFILNGRVGLPRIGGNAMFASTVPADDKYAGLG